MEKAFPQEDTRLLISRRDGALSKALFSREALFFSRKLSRQFTLGGPVFSRKAGGAGPCWPAPGPYRTFQLSKRGLPPS